LWQRTFDQIQSTYNFLIGPTQVPTAVPSTLTTIPSAALYIVTINQKFAPAGDGGSYPTINLAEVQLFNGGVQVPRTQLTFVIANEHEDYPASNCNDGSLTDFCHSCSCSTDASGATLTITSPVSVDQVVVYNRQGYGSEYWIIGATISYSRGSVQLWQRTFDQVQSTYTFLIGTRSPTTIPSAQPSLPSGIPSMEPSDPTTVTEVQPSAFPSVEPTPEPFKQEPSVVPSLVPSGSSQGPSVMLSTAVVVTNNYELLVSEVSASSFGLPEKAAFEVTVALVCGVRASAVKITSVTDVTSSSSGHLVADVQTTLRAKLAFIVTVELHGSSVSAASDANSQLYIVLVNSLNSGSFVTTLHSVASEYGSNVLNTASASSSGLSSNGFTLSSASSRPTSRPSLPYSAGTLVPSRVPIGKPKGTASPSPEPSRRPHHVRRVSRSPNKGPHRRTRRDPRPPFGPVWSGPYPN